LEKKASIEREETEKLQLEAQLKSMDLTSNVDQHGHSASANQIDKKETVSKMKEKARKKIQNKLNQESKLITSLAHHLKETPCHKRGKFCDEAYPATPPRLN